MATLGVDINLLRPRRWSRTRTAIWNTASVSISPLTSPQDYSHKIGDVAFCCSRCHSGTGIKEERFALDLYPIKLKFEESESRETVKGWPFP